MVIADGDTRHRCEVADYLAEHGCTAFDAAASDELDILLQHERIDLVVVDETLPGGDGLSICRRLRRQAGAAIILTSASLDETDRVVALELGADDVLAKPFNMRELLARIRAVLRRPEPTPTLGRPGQLQFAGFIFEPGRRRLRGPTGEAVVLATAQARLLSALLLQPKTLFSREALAGGLGLSGEGRAVDQTVSRLRQCLAASGGQHLIVTRRGLGYLIDCDVVRR